LASHAEGPYTSYRYNDLSIGFDNKCYVKIVCEECKNPSIVSIEEAKMRNSYIHCKHCDAYYKLIFHLAENYSIENFERKIHLRISSERIDKKKLMDKLLLIDDEDGYIILEGE